MEGEPGTPSHYENTLNELEYAYVEDKKTFQMHTTCVCHTIAVSLPGVDHGVVISVVIMYNYIHVSDFFI